MQIDVNQQCLSDNRKKLTADSPSGLIRSKPMQCGTQDYQQLHMSVAEKYAENV